MDDDRWLIEMRLESPKDGRKLGSWRLYSVGEWTEQDAREAADLIERGCVEVRLIYKSERAVDLSVSSASVLDNLGPGPGKEHGPSWGWPT